MTPGAPFKPAVGLSGIKKIQRRPPS